FGGSLFIIGYFAFSPHAKQVFVVPSEVTAKPTSDADEDIYEKPFTWPWFRNLVLYYCVFSIVGHWAEIGFCWLIVLGVVMGDYDFTHAQLWDWWLCPYPAEGIAVVLVALLLFPFKEWVLKKTGGRVWLALIISFLVNMLVCASIDFTTGITANANYELWDYRDLPFNFMGQIVLQNTLVYSTAATFIVWVIYPLMAKWLHRMPPRFANGLFVGFVAFYVFLEVMYYVHIGPNGLVFG
ncbi:MAG: putative ABC transporter permease, partial [Eggerthellaceae bacterium]|nr:putative ABC transporter permease [Eggerthellaceae bacterium]